MTNTIPKRGDVFFCQGSPDAIGSEERKTRPVVIIQNDAGNASSPTVIVANMTTNTSRRLYPMQFDIDLPGHSPSRVQCEQNVAPAGGIVAELLDMKDTLKEVTP